MNLRYLLGLIPKTTDMETKYEGLVKEFNELNEYSASDELKRYLELKQLVQSASFKQKEASVKAQKFNNTSEFQQLTKYQSLKKSDRVKTYYKVKNADILARFKSLDASKELKQYEELSAFVNSSALISIKAKGKKEYKQSPEFIKEQEFIALKKSARFKEYFKFKASNDLKTFTSVDNSGEIKEFEKLEQFVQGAEFKKVQDYYLIPSAKKWEMTEEFQKLQEFITLDKSDRIKWYFKIKDSNKFDILKKWKLSFEDHFNSNTLDKTKWIARYYWGDKLLNDAYSLATDPHFFTDGKNIEISNSILKITTKKENVNGKAWDLEKGFYPKDFSYTSGIINTGDLFRQKYGRFTAKIRLNSNANVSHAFWMLSDRITPQVDILQYNGNKLAFNNYSGAANSPLKNHYSVAGAKVANDFFIYELEWTAQKLSWKINGLIMKEQTVGVPQEPMYIILSSGLYEDLSGAMLPASVEVDWVRVFKND